MVDVHHQHVALFPLHYVESAQHVLVQVEGRRMVRHLALVAYHLHVHLALADVLIHLALLVHAKGRLHVGVRVHGRTDGTPQTVHVHMAAERRPQQQVIGTATRRSLFDVDAILGSTQWESFHHSGFLSLLFLGFKLQI